MRNVLGGLIGVMIGSITIVVLAGIVDPLYARPYDSVWFILSGSSALKATLDGVLNSNTIIAYILTWIIVGIVISPFSKKGWNTIRTVLWAAIILGILSLASFMLLNEGFWTSPTRNIDLLNHFIVVIVVSLCALPSAIPTTMAIERVRKQAELPVPDKIETKCECGAIFKSNPLICSDCGRQLRELEH